MEVRIRLQKVGATAKKRYNYRIIAISRAETRQGRALDILGYYDPAKKPAVMDINMEKVQKWVARGAQLSDTVASLVKKAKKTA